MTSLPHDSPAAPLPADISSYLLDALPDPVLAFDAQHIIQQVNPAAQRLLKSTRQAVGQQLKAVLPPELYTAILKSLADDTAEWRTEDSKTIYALHLKLAVINNDSRNTLYMVVLQDVTRFKLLHQNYEDFVSTVLHDLRTPLTSMRGFTDMLSMVGTVNDIQRQYISKVLSGINQIASLIENSLDAGRLDPMTGSYKLARELCYLNQVVEEVVAAQKGEAEKKNQTIIAETDPSLPPVYLDEVMVRRALNNLVDNAIKYTPEGGKVTVRAYLKDEAAFLSVQDSGAGISTEEQQFVFERFRRLRRPEHVRVKGSGLGLFVVKNVAQWHGGDALIESELGKGSTFIMQLPIVSPPSSKNRPAPIGNGQALV